MSSILRLDRLRSSSAELATLLDSRPDDPPCSPKPTPCWPSWCADDWLPEDCALPIHSATNSTCACHHGSASRCLSFVWGPARSPGTRSSVGADRHATRGRILAAYAFVRGASASSGARRRLEPASRSAAPRIGDVHQVSNAFSDRTSIISTSTAPISVRYGVRCSAPKVGKTLISGYSYSRLPNIWTCRREPA